MAAAMSYGWALLLLLFKELSLDPLFASGEEWMEDRAPESAEDTQPRQLESPIPDAAPDTGPSAPLVGSGAASGAGGSTLPLSPPESQ